VQCSFVGYCYFLLLMFKPKHYPREQELTYYGWGSSYLNAVFSFIVAYTVSYMAVIIGYFVIFPVYCIRIYKEFP